MKKLISITALLLTVAATAFAQQNINQAQKFNSNVTFNDSTYGNPTKVPVTTFEDTLRYTRGAGAGKILASDANGNAYWTNVVLVDTFSGTPVFPSGIKTDTVFTTDFNGTGYVMQLVNDTTGLFKPMVFTNGLTKTGDTTRWGGSVDIGTEINHWFADTLKYSFKIDNPVDDLTTVEWRYDDVKNRRNAIINLWNSEIYGLFAAELVVFDTVANAGSGINTSTAGTGTKWITSSNVANAAYGAEAWTEREETNFYITDNAIGEDLGRWNLGADSLFQSKGYISGYIYEPSTYSGTSNYGNQSVNIDSDGFVFSYKNQRGSYVYPDQRLRSTFTVTDSLIFSKPELGNVFWVDTSGKTTTTSFALVDGTQGLGKVLTSDANGLASWQTASGGAWGLTGNAGTNPTDNFIGTTDGADLLIKANSDSNSILLKLKSGLYQQDFTSNLYNFKSADGATNGFYYNSTSNTLSLLGTFIYSTGNEGAGKVLTSDASGNATWAAASTVSLDSATIYALIPDSGTQYYCTNCTGNGITGRIVAFIGAAWRRITFED